MKLSQSVIDGYVSVFRQKKELVLGRLNSIMGITTPNPQGAFYFLPSVAAFFGKKCPVDGRVINDASVFCESLLLHHQVALTTGDAFGAKGTVRISYATSFETLSKSMDGLEAFCNSLS